uniref:Deoxyuridine 5'-triphosphate nucleotidohydrolase n=1 Tax=Pelusios castaneus TaxID=367368 RepID=A0A8C8S058_9SAUR
QPPTSTPFKDHTALDKTNTTGVDLNKVIPDIIHPRTQKLIPPGTQVQLPKGCYGRVAIVLGWNYVWECRHTGRGGGS